MSASPFHVASRTKRAFTLVELLTVICIMTLLTLLSLPAIVSLSNARHFEQSVLSVASLLEQSHAYAVANNTYVYVGIFSKRDAMNTPELWMAAVASRTGTDVSQGGTQAIDMNDPEQGALFFRKVDKFSQLDFKSGSEINSSQVQRPSNAQSINITGSPTALFGPISQMEFSTLLCFNPDGTVSNNSTLNSQFEFGVQSTRHSQDVAVIQIAGMTGLIKVYQP